MFRKINERYLRGFGFLPVGKREVLNFTYNAKNFYDYGELGASFTVNSNVGIFLGLTVWKLTVWINIFGIAGDFGDNDIEY